MSEQHLAYWVDLQAIKFDDHKPNSAWMQAFPTGVYKHPVYGKIKMTVERAKAMASNVIRKVRGIDIAIDYGHESAGEAAGWVSSAEARSDGLWLFVDWTDDAAADIRSGKYRYFSPEFVDVWQHPETGEKFKDVLFGGGLTNRPFLKNIMPVNLSEVLAQEAGQVGLEGGDMEKFLEALRKKFKLAEDASEDDILKALNEALQANTKEKDSEEDPVEAPTEEQVAKILEEHPALAGVLEMNKTLVEQNKTLAGKVVNLEIHNRNQSVSSKLTEWHAGGEKSKYGLPTVLDEKVTAFMLSTTAEQVSAFETIMDEIVKTGLVTLGETKIRRRPGDKPEKSAFSEVEDGIKKLIDDNESMSYADASTQLFRDDEDLYERYMEESLEADEGVDA